MRPGANRRDHLFVVGVVPPPRVHAAAVCGSEPVADAEVDVMEQDLSLQDIVGT